LQCDLEAQKLWLEGGNDSGVVDVATRREGGGIRSGWSRLTRIMEPVKATNIRCALSFCQRSLVEPCCPRQWRRTWGNVKELISHSQFTFPETPMAYSKNLTSLDSSFTINHTGVFMPSRLFLKVSSGINHLMQLAPTICSDVTFIRLPLASSIRIPLAATFSPLRVEGSKTPTPNNWYRLLPKVLASAAFRVAEDAA